MARARHARTDRDRGEGRCERQRLSRVRESPMSDYDPNRTTVVTSNGGGNGGLYLVVGMLVVAVLVGAYILMGTPGLHSQVASAPAGASGQKVDVTVQQPTPPARAPATPAPATPAPARPERR